MPNFTAKITAGATQQIWTDPPTVDKPTRLNNDPVRPHTYRQVTVGAPVTVSATVDGVEAPLDADLDEPFSTWFGEVPIWPAPALSSPVGQSSVASFTPNRPGHYLLVMHRESGGRFLVPFVAVAP